VDFEYRSQNGQSSRDHHARADGEAEGEIVESELKIGLGYEFGHDELPRDFGMGFRLVLRDAIVPKVLGIG